MIYLGAFLITLFIEIIWADYTFALVDRQAFKAAIYAAIITGGNQFMAMSSLNYPLCVLAIVCGAFVGTWIAVEWRAEHDKPLKSPH